MGSYCVYIHTSPYKDEWKAKISASKKGRPGRVWTDEQRRQHSERMKRVYGAKAL